MLHMERLYKTIDGCSAERVVLRERWLVLSPPDASIPTVPASSLVSHRGHVIDAR